MHEKTDEFDMVDTEIEVEVNNSSTKCKTRFISLHKPISVSICSNAPGFTQPHHIVKSISEKQLVIDMIKYMMEIQTHVSSILKDKFSELFQRLDTYRESLIDKATAVKSKQATHEWDEPELQEVQQYIADVMWSILIIIITGSMITTGCDVEHLHNNNYHWFYDNHWM